MNTINFSLILDSKTRLAGEPLRISAYATRTGVFNYPNHPLFKRHARKPEHVFDSASLETLKNLPITSEHPMKDGKFILLDTSNIHEFQKGYTGEKVEIIDKKTIKINLIITDEKLIEEIESQERAYLSCGYTADTVAEKGIYDGLEYDAVQKNIKQNHLAVVRNPRGGQALKVLLDSENSYFDSLEIISEVPTEEKPKMPTIIVDSKETEVPEVAKILIEQKFLKDSQEITNLTKNNETLQAKYDQLETDKKELKLQLDSIDVNALVKERVTLINRANKLINDDKVILDSLIDPKDIKITAINKHYPDLDLSKKTDEYINARFDALEETVTPESQTNKAFDEAKRKAGNATITDSSDQPALSAREKMIQENLAAASKPL